MMRNKVRLSNILLKVSAFFYIEPLVGAILVLRVALPL